MSDEIDTNQSPEQPVEQSPVTSTPNIDKIQEISEFYQEKKTTTSEATAEPIIERSPIDYYIGAFRKYADFSGCARRSEYWWFILLTSIVFILVSFISESLNIKEDVGGIYTLISSIPLLAVIARRLHDVGKSGWLQLLGFVAPWVLGLLVILIALTGGRVQSVLIILIAFSIIPIYILIRLFILYIKDSTPGANKYGPNPKGIES
jgi:uncharacterized membrane protein YhaH (DUF805 family)